MAAWARTDRISTRTQNFSQTLCPFISTSNNKHAMEQPTLHQHHCLMLVSGPRVSFCRSRIWQRKILPQASITVAAVTVRTHTNYILRTGRLSRWMITAWTGRIRECLMNGQHRYISKCLPSVNFGTHSTIPKCHIVDVTHLYRHLINPHIHQQIHWLKW